MKHKAEETFQHRDYKPKSIMRQQSLIYSWYSRISLSLEYDFHPGMSPNRMSCGVIHSEVKDL